MKVNLKLMVLITLSITPVSMSAYAFQGADEATQAHCQKYRDNTTQAKQNELDKYIPKPANEYYSTGTCLDSILNSRINIFTMGSLDSILQGVMNAATNRACQAVMGGWNQAVGQANGALGTAANLPYGGGTIGTGVNVGTGLSGAPITINGGSVNQAATQPTSQIDSATAAVKSTANKLLDIFR
ncbi:MAG: hypothetical protein CTY35_00415 [Methylotenera sp.]|uniref:hypothetical protein n=1 Tax=Methylotenera sp. TaxID=2051956 RepID=UPI000D44FFDC|nr:hypothetical protein [Methylotenera sp.]PPC84818.1 MAG: hypothetical protein CTY38_00410 [Methylotenera sp.]PPD02178.1 MAG: hypothetical protein CTY35_00415 [Methylotenera sp.]